MFRISGVLNARSLLTGVSTPLSAVSVPQVFGGDVPMTRSSELKADESGYLGSVCLSYSTASTPSYSTASTQTPPELGLPQDDLQMGNDLKNGWSLSCPACPRCLVHFGLFSRGDFGMVGGEKSCLRDEDMKCLRNEMLHSVCGVNANVSFLLFSPSLLSRERIPVRE